MIVPSYWSEAKEKRTIEGRQFTVKRFGWSDISEQDAKVHAESRLQEALIILEKEGDIRRIDHKASYNGAEGIPIREEVISKHQDVVISRNSYGALCLNTPDVLFADIDFKEEASLKTSSIVFMLLAACSSLVAFLFQSWVILLVGLFVSILFSSTIANLCRKMFVNMRGGVEKITLEKIKVVSSQNPELNIRLYRTPMGYRALLMNDTYSPTDTVSLNLLERFNSDSVYIQMCRNQRCFRARVSPKPWRIGVSRLRPRPGVWPINSEHLAERKKWVDLYNEKSENYSSCRYLLQMGSDKVDEKAEFVRQLHDDLCKVVNKELKIA